MHVLRSLVLGAALSLSASVASAQAYNMTLSGASPSGFWTMIGVGVDSVMKAAHPGSTITYQTSGGGLANVGLLDQGKVELGLAHDAELRIAADGGKPFSKPVRSLRAIAARANRANTTPNRKPAICAGHATAPNAGPL